MLEDSSKKETNLVNAAIRSLFLRHSAKLSATDSSVSKTSITYPYEEKNRRSSINLELKYIHDCT